MTEARITDELDENLQSKKIHSETSLVVAKAVNKHIIVEYFIKPAVKIDKLYLKMNPFMLLKGLYPVTRVTNMIACIGARRLTHVKSRNPLSLLP